MINYIVTDKRELWLDNVHNKFIADPFLYHQLIKNNEADKYNIVGIAQYARQSVNDLKKDNDFVVEKYKKYIPILSDRLNQIHNSKYSKEFWEKALSVGFERYIVFMYELYRNSEVNFDKDKHICKVVSLESIEAPIDFDNQRDLFQHSALVQEQIFSLYINCFYPSVCESINVKSYNNKKLKKDQKSKVWGKLFNASKVKREVIKILYRYKNHKIGVIGSFFSPNEMSDLIVRSNGLVYPFEWHDNIENDLNELHDRERDLLASFDSKFDKFDKFFFYSMKYFFPKLLVENFTRAIDQFHQLYNKNTNLKYIVSEAWMSVSSLSLKLAYLKTKGVKHIYNEHNYYAHPFVGSELDRAIDLVDIFISLGWYDSKYSNMIRGGSLFDFKIIKSDTPSYDICFITDPKLVRRPQFTATMGSMCENVEKSYNFTKLFFTNLNDDLLQRIYFRGYPKSMSNDWMIYDDAYMLQPFYDKLSKIDPDKESGLESMSKSKLVVVDYISTPYLQSIVSDIPTIFFHNQSIYFLKEEYKTFFDPLIEAGICHTSPESAAEFIATIIDDPNKWWDSMRTKELRDVFLKDNFGEEATLSDYLIGISEC